MKKQNLKTFSKAYLKKLTQTPNQFKVNQMLVDVDTTHHRLYAPLLTWCFLTQKRVPTSSSLYHELQTLKEGLSQNCTEEDLLSFYQQSNNVELVKFVEAYQNENKQRDEPAKFRLYQSRNPLLVRLFLVSKTISRVMS